MEINVGGRGRRGRGWRNVLGRREGGDEGCHGGWKKRGGEMEIWGGLDG